MPPGENDHRMGVKAIFFLTDFIFDQQTAINRVSDVSGHKPGKMHSALKSRRSRTMIKTCAGLVLHTVPLKMEP